MLIATINILDKWRQSPLHYAASGGHVETVNLLLEYQAHIDPSDEYMWTPLHYATQGGHIEVTVNNYNLLLYIFYILYTSFLSKKELLLKHGATVDSQDIFDRTPLHLASFHGYTEIAKLLLENKAAIDLFTNWKSTPLHVAASKGHADIVKILLMNNADRTLKNEAELTPLQEALQEGQTEIANILVTRGNRQSNFFYAF